MKRHLTLANQLTIARLVMVPFIGYLLVARFHGHDIAALALFLLAALTDTLDGQIARRRNQVSELGKFLDPLADKFLIVTVLVILVGRGSLPFWVVLIIFGREFLITGLRSVAASRGVVIAATSWGKSKTLSQTVMIVLILLEGAMMWLKPFAIGMIAIATVATVLSGLDYLWRYRKFVV